MLDLGKQIPDGWPARAGPPPLPAGHPTTPSSDRRDETGATPGGARVAAGYLTVTNTGPAPDRLTGGTIAAAGRGELHTLSMEGGAPHSRWSTTRCS